MNQRKFIHPKGKLFLLLGFLFYGQMKTTRFIETERMVKQRVTVNAALFPESEQNCSYTFAYPPVLVEGLGNIDVCFGIKILHTPFLSNSVYCRQGLVLIQGWLPQVLPS